MQTARFTYWQDDETFIGYFLDFPDDWTQADTLDDLKTQLLDLYRDLTSGSIPGIRRVEDLIIA